MIKQSSVKFAVTKVMPLLFLALLYSVRATCDLTTNTIKQFQIISPGTFDVLEVSHFKTSIKADSDPV